MWNYSIDVVKLLLTAPNLKIDLHQKDATGVNSFWVAAYHNHARIMKYLYQQGIDVKVHNDIGSNSLHIAVKKRNKEAV